jgi:hypothetical protein
MNKDIKNVLELYLANGYISNYDYTNDEITIRYTLHNGLETERTINYNVTNGNLDGFLNALIESANNVRDDIYNCLTDEFDFFGYSSKEELEERIKEEEIYLKSLVVIYGLKEWV